MTNSKSWMRFHLVPRLVTAEKQRFSNSVEFTFVIRKLSTCRSAVSHLRQESWSIAKITVRCAV